MLTHDSLHSIGPITLSYPYNYGDKGVDVFFAISGILICTRLLEEEDRFGSISLRGFYLRRIFRILPAAVLYLAAIGTMGLLGWIHISRGEWLGSLFFYRNYASLWGRHLVDRNASWFTGHFWSLSVEEHFYLILPTLLIFTPKRLRVLVLSILAVVVTVNRGIQLQHRPWNLIGGHSDVRLDSLLIPAALAITIKSDNRYRLDKLLRFWPLFLVLTLLIIPTSPGTFWQTTTLALLFPMVVMGSVLHSNNYLGRGLEFGPLRFIGRISYGLYLWQMLFFTGHHYLQRPLGKFESFPLNFLATFCCAVASYYLVEQPMMRLGHKIAPPATPGRDDLQSNLFEAEKEITK
jgi:peptidoglycan/LPS O-acetylase OafA/YrhL